MTINSLPQDERSRSGSQPRFPYMDRQPFQEQDRGHYGQSYQQPRPQQTRPDSGGYPRPQAYEGVQSTIKGRVDQDRRMFQEKQRIADSREYQQLQDEQVPNDPNSSNQIQTQIFYKGKDNSKVVYEEGQETWRGPEKLREKQRSEVQKEQELTQQRLQGGVQVNAGAALRRRGVSPQTQEVVKKQKQEYEQHSRDVR